MIGALVYLRLTSFRNLVAYRIRRLRRPKYLFGTAVAVAYLYYFFLRRLLTPGAPAAPRGAPANMAVFLAGMVCVSLVAVALLRIAYAWISPPLEPALHFSEAEIAFLFPAPIARKTLIHFRLVSGQLAILFTSVIMAVVFNRFGYGGGNRLTRAVGFWVVLSTFGLHLAGTNLFLSRLRETSARYVLWRIGVVSAIVLYVLAIAWSATAFARWDTSAYPSFNAYASGVAPDLLRSSPLRWLILPFRIVFAPYFAGSAREFCIAMIPALGLLAIHYRWVSSSEARFEEGSIALAEKRAAARAAAVRGEAPRVGAAGLRAQPGPFPLSPVGPPEVAFLWKNLLSMRSSLMTRRTVVMALMVTLWMSFALGPFLSRRAGGSNAYAPVIVVFCCICAGYTLLLGPQIARQDLRSDIPNVDILKTFPIEGWRLALGELLAPAAILSAVLWFLIIVGACFVDSGGQIGWLTPGVRLVAALCLGAAAPVFCMVQLIVPNLIMVLFPGWYQASRSRGGGIELMGQRLILGIAQLLFALFVAAPSVGAAVLIIFASYWLVGVGPAIAIAALVVLPILAGEVAVGLWCIGDRFERFDLSAEIR
jgi:hypothetical protein